MSLDPSIVSPTTGLRRSMTEEHRKHLSRSIKDLWARRGGLSEEHRRKISQSIRKRQSATRASA